MDNKTILIGAKSPLGNGATDSFTYFHITRLGLYYPEVVISTAITNIGQVFAIFTESYVGPVNIPTTGIGCLMCWPHRGFVVASIFQVVKLHRILVILPSKKMNNKPVLIGAKTPVSIGKPFTQQKLIIAVTININSLPRLHPVGSIRGLVLL